MVISLIVAIQVSCIDLDGAPIMQRLIEWIYTSYKSVLYRSRLAGHSHHHYLEDWDWSTANLRVVLVEF